MYCLLIAVRFVEGRTKPTETETSRNRHMQGVNTWVHAKPYIV